MATQQQQGKEECCRCPKERLDYAILSEYFMDGGPQGDDTLHVIPVVFLQVMCGYDCVMKSTLFQPDGPGPELHGEQRMCSIVREIEPGTSGDHLHFRILLSSSPCLPCAECIYDVFSSLGNRMNISVDLWIFNVAPRGGGLDADVLRVLARMQTDTMFTISGMDGVEEWRSFLRKRDMVDLNELEHRTLMEMCRARERLDAELLNREILDSLPEHVTDV